MSIYNVDVTSSVTSTIPWHQTYYPYTWTTSSHAQKCPNCGYCSCCGKSDVPGKLTPDTDE